MKSNPYQFRAIIMIAEVVINAPVAPVSAAALASGQVQVQQPIQHILSKELQLYFDKVRLDRIGNSAEYLWHKLA